MARRAVIFLSGELNRWPQGLALDSRDLIVCADGGYANALRFDIHPRLLLGDMDSIAPEQLQTARERGIEECKFPAEKDMTDSDLALSYVLEQGCGEAHLVGSWGHRWDHGIANILLLSKWRDHGMLVHLWDETNHLQLISAEAVSLAGKPGDYVSLIPLTPEATGVTTAGLKYPLSEARLMFGSTLGVSNEMLGEQAQVLCRTGRLLVTHFGEQCNEWSLDSSLRSE